MAHHTEVHPPSDPTEQSAAGVVGPVAGAVLVGWFQYFTGGG